MDSFSNVSIISLIPLFDFALEECEFVGEVCRSIVSGGSSLPPASNKGLEVINREPKIFKLKESLFFDLPLSSRRIGQ